MVNEQKKGVCLKRRACSPFNITSLGVIVIVKEIVIDVVKMFIC